MTKTLVFRIRKRYFDDIVAGKKKVEYRRNSPYWRARLFGGNTPLNHVRGRHLFFEKTGDFFEGLLLCGKRKHSLKIWAVEKLATPNYFSDQGKKDVDTPTCFGFHLGDVILI